MADNFDLKQFLKESKALQNLNPFLSENYEADEKDDMDHIDALEKDIADDKESALRKKLREMILAEMELDINDTDDEYDPTMEEAKKKKKKDEEVEDIEDISIEDLPTDAPEEVPAEDMPMDDMPSTDGESAPRMSREEEKIMNDLEDAIATARELGNEKLVTQIGNTITFLTRQTVKVK